MDYKHSEAFWIFVSLICCLATFANGQRGSSRLLRVSTVQIEPYVMLEGSHSSNGTNTYLSKPSFKGFIPDLLRKLSYETGFDFELHLVKEGSFGYRTRDGRWNGIIGEIISGIADLGAAPLYVNNVRKRVVDFTEPFMTVQATLLFRKPPQGPDSLHIRTVSDLLSQSEISYGTLDHGMIMRAFRNTNDSMLQQMWRTMGADRYLLTENNIEGVQRVRTEKYAFVLPDAIGEYLSLRRPCDLMAVDRFLMKEYYAFALPHGSEHKAALDEAMVRLRASGFLDQLRFKWWQEQDECQTAIHSSRMYSGRNAANNPSPAATWLCILAVVVASARS